MCRNVITETSSSSAKFEGHDTYTAIAWFAFQPLFSLVYCSGGKLSGGRHHGQWRGWRGWSYMWLVFAF